ncbi:hypothetical protein Cantr_02294 [Candida viswanathii]|uniref:Uncharacterized protein n=1 Tax=Candida viswanathii TaxID=5486 RepID=A0A367YNI2_9ASCO|nr:hypothetical protein Cantr_02294 [Candida viswanathii]
MLLVIGRSTVRLASRCSLHHHNPHALSVLTSRRFESTKSDINEVSNKVAPLIPAKNSIFVISIPITTSRSYIYCNHRPSTLSPKQLAKIPFIYRLEGKIVKLASKGWSKLVNSKQSINQKIVQFVKRLLDTIPYEESCLRSFPSKATMIREINEESLHLVRDEKDHKVVPGQYDDLKIDTNQLKPIPLFHPQFQKPTTILTQLYSFEEENKKRHTKQAIMCAVGVPLTLPFALVPVVPNVPGFYLAFRLYCNIKALLGIQHLDYLLENKQPGEHEVANEATVNDTSHITFKPLEGLDQLYAKYNEPRLLNEVVQEDETVIINKEIIDELVEKSGLTNIKEDLLKAYKQETKRLNKDIKVEDQVE